ncbi:MULTISPECIES: hypothetical protein [unclassified Pseudoalteromonas]|nr:MULTISPECIES: hypothetical protein [unclassified Pseudoalteromonas]
MPIYNYYVEVIIVNNTPYRFGGEEFYILSQANIISEASKYAEKSEMI